jgi:hypothetical protein
VVGRILVEDGDAAEGPRHPFRVVLGEVGVDRLQERPNERYLPCWTDNRAFAIDVHDCATVSTSRRNRCIESSYIDRTLSP